MSLSKFGQTTKRSGVRGERGTGFALTPDSDYDMMNKRLTKLAPGVDLEDAARLDQISEEIEKKALSAESSDGPFNAKKKRVTEVGFPRHASDAATKVYVDRNCMMQDV